MAKKILKIGNAGGYWGDDPKALERQVFGGHLDYITIDFLAEITMSIMQKQRSRDPHLGYAKDFIVMLEKVLAKLLEQKTTVISNAGGVNPQACAEAIAKLGQKLGLKPKISVVYGDDILHDIDRLCAQDIAFKNMETSEQFETIRSKLQAANVYFGAAPVVEALKEQPDIIVTGRVTDTGITLAPMIYEFGWRFDDWDKLASGIVAGHMIECGTQITGGNFTDWQLVKSFDAVGFPCVEVEESGDFVLTKHPNSGGLVSVDTVREQVFYEMGNPKAYITPDVIADFSTILLQQDGPERVKVSGIKGYQPTDQYKVSMAYSDSYKNVGSILICGPDARHKAETFAKIFWARCPDKFLETHTEYIGWNACHQSLTHAEDGNEILIRLGARSDDYEKLNMFGKLIPSLILSGPPGTAVIGGAPKPQEVISYWPALMPKTAITPKIAVYQQGKGLVNIKDVTTTIIGKFKIKDSSDVQIAKKPSMSISSVLEQLVRSDSKPPRHSERSEESREILRLKPQDDAIELIKICLARSGDKGDTANIGVMARNKPCFEFLDGFLTAQLVKNLFQELCMGTVTRYKLDGLLGFNFLLESSLGGGGTKTLRIDAQGKTFAQALLRQKVLIPKDVLNSIK